jgi:hypothetical protein
LGGEQQKPIALGQQGFHCCRLIICTMGPGPEGPGPEGPGCPGQLSQLEAVLLQALP